MAGKNPNWSRDELIVAFDLYMRFEGNPPGKTSREITELSDLLNRMGQQQEGRQDTFRNASGVYMKAMNFRRLDPRYKDAGKKGLQRGNKDEEVVWEIFAHDPKRLREVASAIRATVEAGEVPPAPPDEEEEDEGGEEGRMLSRVHRSRERNRKIVNKKKSQVLEREGRLQCEACGFDYAETFGERGWGFIEAHHTKPVETLLPGSKTKVGDLALLCANCHRMIHVARPWLTVEELCRLLGGEPR